MSFLTWLIPLLVAAASLLALIGQLILKIHRLINRVEVALPTLERIAKTYPGRKLQREMGNIERAIDMQSQELFRLAQLIDRRKSELRPPGWDKESAERQVRAEHPEQ